MTRLSVYQTFCLKPIGLCVEKHRNSMLYITAMNQTIGYLTGSICSFETHLFDRLAKEGSI